jgi:dolichyl-phosphate-mannose--protein O-mannosyl transferase
LCIFAFAVRVYRVGEIKSYIFDEVYHTVTAKLIARDDPRAYEWWNPPIEPNTAVDWLHPPLAKYTQALGMKVFGETPFGWRISSVLFGTAVVWLTAELARYLFKDKTIGLLSGFFVAMDGLLLVQSRLAMNDIHVAFMLLLTFLLYAWYRRELHAVIDSPKKFEQERTELRKRFLLAGLCAGLAMGTKWSGLFGLGVLWLFEFVFLMTDLHKVASGRNAVFKAILGRVLVLGVLPFTVYILSYTHMFLQGKSFHCDLNMVKSGTCYCSQESSPWVLALETVTGSESWQNLEARGGCKRLISHFSELHHQIFWYQTTLKATHAYQSRPIQWFLNLRPVWMYVNYGDGKIANIYAQGNPALFWFGDIALFVTVLTLGIHSVKLLTERTKQRASSAAASLTKTLRTLTTFDTPLSALFYVTIAYFAVWLPWQLSPRIMFFYHYTPAVPLLSIILAYWVKQLLGKKKGVLLAGAVLLIVLNVFILFFPNWTGLPVTNAFANGIYFRIPSWK